MYFNNKINQENKNISAQNKIQLEDWKFLTSENMHLTSNRVEKNNYY